MDKIAIAYIFYDPQNKKYLIENRIDKQVAAGEKVFPGGKVEDDEKDNLEKALVREAKEELGIEIIKWVDLEKSVILESGYILHPYLITSWNGEIPDKVLDKGSKLEWVAKDKFKPRLESIKKLLRIANSYVAQSL